MKEKNKNESNSERKLTAEMKKHGWQIAPDGKVYVGDRIMTVSAARAIVRSHEATQAYADAHDDGSNEPWGTPH